MKTTLFVTSTYGVEQFPACTWVGTEGVAQIQSNTHLEVARFDDVPYLLEQPVSVSSTPADCMDCWILMNGQYQPVFRTATRTFGRALESVHAKHWAPRLLAQLDAGQPVRVWGAQPRYVELRKGSVEVQQWGRRDTVAPKDVTVAREGGDVVLRATAFYEARFIIGETPNATLLMILLKMIAS